MDKLAKVRAEVEKLNAQLLRGACSSQVAMETRCKEGAYDEVLAILDTMQEEPVSKQKLSNVEKTVKDWKEPVSEELEKVSDKYSEDIESDYSNDMFDRGDIMKAFEAGANWQREKDESTTEDLGKYINELSKQFPEVSFAKLSRIAVRVAKWQKENLWKPADGDNLPEIDREVIVLVKYSTQRNIHDKEYSTYRVGFGHRPNPDGWDGKSLTTGKVEHHTPQCYDKGGWNQPNVQWWLDVDKLPNKED